MIETGAKKMKGLINKILVLFLSLAFLMLGNFVHPGYAQKTDSPVQPAGAQDIKSAFIQSLCNSVSSAAANLVFDYRLRPVIGVLVADFVNTAGEEIELGNQITLELRAALYKGKQFNVYGNDHPVSQSLKASLSVDPKWKVSSQRNFQQNILKKFKQFPVDLIITGQVSPEPGDRIKVAVNLIPFYKTISLVETESGRTDIRSDSFLSPPLSSQEIDKGLAVIKIPKVEKGRLVIIASMKVKKEYAGREILSSKDRTATKIIWDTEEPTGKTMSLKDITCWLDDKEISVIKDKDWEDVKKKTYYNILSGFGADTIWFEDMIKEGPHSIFFSLVQNPAKGGFKTQSQPFIIKNGTTNYLYFTFHGDAQGEIEVKIRQILDPQNQPLPF
jgi:hypothetical protein